MKPAKARSVTQKPAESRTLGQRQLAAAKAGANRRKGEASVRALQAQLRDLLPDLEPEVRFHPTRKWRLDCGSRSRLIGIEVEGGAFAKGGSRHTRGAGFRADLEKYLAAAEAGWLVLRVLPEWVGTARVRIAVEAIVARQSEPEAAYRRTLGIGPDGKRAPEREALIKSLGWPDIDDEDRATIPR